MARPSKRRIARALLERYGTTYAEEAGIRLRDAPAPLFQLLVLALLASARIPARNAVRATKALIDAGLTTPRKMAGATWQERVDVITWHGYKRYDESASTMLGQTAELLLQEYRGDLRALREEAEGDVAEMKRRLQEFKGIGRVGADIFLREVQGVWPEVRPYVDARVLAAAERLGLGDDPRGLARLVPREELPRLVAGLMRVALAKAHDEVLEAAG